MMSTIKAQIRKLDFPTQVKLLTVILKILEEPTIKRMISFDDFINNGKHQSIIISQVLDSGIDQVYKGMPDDDVTVYTFDQRESLFFKLFVW